MNIGRSSRIQPADPSPRKRRIQYHLQKKTRKKSPKMIMTVPDRIHQATKRKRTSGIRNEFKRRQVYRESVQFEEEHDHYSPHRSPTQQSYDSPSDEPQPQVFDFYKYQGGSHLLPPPLSFPINRPSSPSKPPGIQIHFDETSHADESSDMSFSSEYSSHINPPLSFPMDLPSSKPPGIQIHFDEPPQIEEISDMSFSSEYSSHIHPPLSFPMDPQPSNPPGIQIHFDEPSHANESSDMSISSEHSSPSPPPHPFIPLYRKVSNGYGFEAINKAYLASGFGWVGPNHPTRRSFQKWVERGAIPPKLSIDTTKSIEAVYPNWRKENRKSRSRSRSATPPSSKELIDT